MCGMSGLAGIGEYRRDPAALQGSAAPSGGSFDFLNSVAPVLNGNGQLAFKADLIGTGVTTANNTAPKIAGNLADPDASLFRPEDDSRFGNRLLASFSAFVEKLAAA